MNEVDEHIAWPPLWLCLRIDDRKIVWHATCGPCLCARCPPFECVRLICSRYFILTCLQAGVDEITGSVGDRRIRGVVGKNDRDGFPAGEIDKLRRAERVMTHLDGVAQLAAVERLGKQVEKSSEVGCHELLRWREFQSIGPSWSPSSVTPKSKNRLIESPASASTRRFVA